MTGRKFFVGVLAIAGLGTTAIALAQPSSFRPARPPVNMARFDPPNAAIFELSYCYDVQITRWYNEVRGRFSKSELEQAAALAVARCDHLVDAATRRNMAIIRQLSTNPKFADRAKAALAQRSFADWRADEVVKARNGAMSYVRGIQIATQPAVPDESRPY